MKKKMMIAKYIESAREVVSRMLKYFATAGIVTRHRGSIKIIDKSRLYTIVGKIRILHALSFHIY